MSLILDALRRGRARETPPPGTNAAQTNAVLETLGYGRFSPASPFNKLKRIAAYVAIGIILAIAIWAGVAWAQAYVARKRPAGVSNVRGSSLATASAARPTPAPAMPPPPAAPAPEPAPVGTTPEPSPAPSAVAAGPPTPTGATLSAAPPRGSTTAVRRATVPETAALSPGTSPANSSDPRPAAVQPLPMVQNSRRPDVPANVPTPPPAAPSGRTSLSTSAASNAGKLVSESDHFQLALYYQRIGDFENSLVHYRAVLQRDELNAEAHNNLGLLYRDKGLFDDAVKEFVRAIAINQRYVKAHNNLGVVYLSQHKDEAAASEFRTALSIDSRNVESLVNLSLAEKEAGRRDEARATLVRALEIDPHSAGAHYNLALIADEMGDKAQALTHFRAFLQYATDLPDLIPEVRKRIQLLETKN